MWPNNDRQSTPVIWIASYPKSGNTWLRHILNQLLCPDVGGHISVPFHAREFPEDIYVHELPIGNVHLVKTHSYPGSEQLNAVSNPFYGAITIRRHPLDILLSAVNYNGIKTKSEFFLGGSIKTVDKIIEDGEFDHYVEQFIELDGVSTYCVMSGPWSQYQSQWNDVFTGPSHLTMVYEDMVARPEHSVMQISEYFQLDTDMNLAHDIVERVEEKTQVNGEFYWRKQAYNYRKLLPLKTIQRFERHFEKQLLKLGYALTDSVSIHHKV
ncbi:MAG: sulfotransferase domain-containing protein [Halieaceae bacterium]